jgi:hypothetical protein
MITVIDLVCTTTVYCTYRAGRRREYDLGVQYTSFYSTYKERAYHVLYDNMDMYHLSGVQNKYFKIYIKSTNFGEYLFQFKIKFLLQSTRTFEWFFVTIMSSV